MYMLTGRLLSWSRSESFSSLGRKSGITHSVPPCRRRVPPACAWHLHAVQPGDRCGSRDPWSPIVVKSGERAVPRRRRAICVVLAHQRCLVKRAVDVRHSAACDLAFGFLLGASKQEKRSMMSSSLVQFRPGLAVLGRSGWCLAGSVEGTHTCATTGSSMTAISKSAPNTEPTITRISFQSVENHNLIQFKMQRK